MYLEKAHNVAIDDFLTRLERIWQAQPTMRLGQMIFNALGQPDTSEMAGLALMSNEDLLVRLQRNFSDQYLEEVAREQEGPRDGDLDWIPIKDAIETLRTLWKGRPNFLFGQMIYQAVKQKYGPFFCHGYYGVDDEELLACLRADFSTGAV